jgi:tRNA-Thr(GGU) m(6)t(6)A37 methyltransferase TsaA
MPDNEKRPGEIALPFDPATTADDGAIVFIGRIRSPWKIRAECPKNMEQARERGRTAIIEIDDAWRAGLNGLQKFSHAIVLYWMQEARRDLIVQKPHHKPEPTGVFALRSPVRPNPIALATVRILDVNQTAGRITVDAIDCLDCTPLLDIRPWLETLDRAAFDQNRS